MENSRLFQYAILWHPTKEQKDKKSALIVEPTTILAKNEQVAQMMAVKAIPDEFTDQLEQVDIAIRPF